MPSTTLDTAAHGIASGMVTRNRDGYWIIGDPNLGCQFCGAITAFEGREGGQTILYHPSVECCPQAVARQINWRTDELERINRSWTAEDMRIQELEAEAAELRGLKAAEAKNAAARARRGLNARIEQVWKAEVKALGEEIRRLKAVRADQLAGKA